MRIGRYGSDVPSGKTRTQTRGTAMSWLVHMTSKSPSRTLTVEAVLSLSMRKITATRTTSERAIWRWVALKLVRRSKSRGEGRHSKIGRVLRPVTALVCSQKGRVCTPEKVRWDPRHRVDPARMAACERPCSSSLTSMTFSFNSVIFTRFILYSTILIQMLSNSSIAAQ